MRIAISAVLAALVSLSLSMPAFAEEQTAAAKAADGPPTAAKDVGARYGQALGAVEICIGSAVTDKAKALEATFTGAELEDFKAQAAKVFAAWQTVKVCANQKDPNQCKIIMDRSCEAALAEIGPTGSVIPGLLDPPAKK